MSRQFDRWKLVFTKIKYEISSVEQEQQQHINFIDNIWYLLNRYMSR